MEFIISIINNYLNIFKNKLSNKNDELMQNNAEYILDEAISEYTKSIEEYTSKISTLKTLQNNAEIKINEFQTKLSNIQNGIKKAQKDNDIDSINEGNILYKQIEKVLEAMLIDKEQIDLGISDLEKFLSNSIQEIDKLKIEKVKLLIQLQNAETKELIINMKDDLHHTSNNNYNEKFDKIKEQINKRVDNINNKEQLINSIKYNKYFNNI